MAQFEIEILPGRRGVVVAEGALADVYRRDPAYTEVLTDEQVDALKGPELDAELVARRLPTTGRVAERRARLRGDAPTGPTTLEPVTTPDPGVLAADADRDAIGAPPTTTGVALDRDAEHSKEN